MSLSRIQRGDLTIFYFREVISGDCSREMSEALAQEIASGVKRFVFNLQQVRQIDSRGVGALMGLQHCIEAAEGSLVLTRVPPNVREVLRISRLDSVLNIVEEAGGPDLSSGREIPPPPGDLVDRVEKVWAQLIRRDDGAEPAIPENFASYLRDLSTQSRRLLNANHVLRDLLIHGDIEVAHTEDRHRRLFENAGDALMVVETTGGTIIEANRRAQDLTGVEGDRLLGRRLGDFLPDVGRMDLESFARNLVERETQSSAAELHLMRADGTVVPVEMTVGVVSLHGEWVIQVHLRDISIHQEMERLQRGQILRFTRLNAIERCTAGSGSRADMMRDLLAQTQALLRSPEGALIGLSRERGVIETIDWGEIPEGAATRVKLTHHISSKPQDSLVHQIEDTEITGIDRASLREFANADLIPQLWTRLDRTWLCVTIPLRGTIGAVLLFSRPPDLPLEEGELIALQNLRTVVGLRLENLVLCEDIHRTQEEHRILFEGSRDAACIVDLSTGRIAVANERMADLVGESRDQIVGSLLLGLLNESDWPKMYENMRLLAERHEGQWDCRLSERMGESARWVEMRANLLPTTGDTAGLALFQMIDFSADHQRAEELNRLSGITAANPNAVMKLDAGGHVLYTNPGVERFLRRAGMPPDAPLRALPKDIGIRIARMLAGSGEPETFEHTVNDRTLLCTLSVDQRACVAILHAVEITAQKHLEQAIAEREADYRSLVDGALEGICTLRDGRFHMVNRHMCEIFSVTPDRLVGTSLREHVHLEDWPDLCERLHDFTHSDASTLETEFRVVDGEEQVRNIHAAFVPAHVGHIHQLTGYFSDMTEQRQIEKQLVNLQIAETIGHVAHSIAQDFSEILADISQGLSDLTTGLGSQGETSPRLETIRASAERGHSLAEDLLAFSQAHEIHAETVDLRDLLTSCAGRVESALHQGMAVQCTASQQPMRVCVDAEQLQRSVVSLCSHMARLVDGSEGISLRALLVVLGRPEVERIPDASLGLHHCLEISCIGGQCGQGMGLKVSEDRHLSMVKNLVGRMGGVIDTVTDEGADLTVRLFFLPAPESRSREAEAKPEERVLSDRVILVIDDEDLVRDLTHDILEDAGYSVMSAENGAKAVECFREHGDKIAAVVLDIVMPVMDGRETFRRLREMQPDLPILLASGFTAETDTRELLQRGQADFLAKPFRRETLLEKIENLIAASAL